MNQNKLLPGEGVADRLARRAVADREAGYADEVRRLLDAALAEIHRRGMDSKPRVADIVAAAGLSNDAFYRHFRSKDALMAALVADGAERLTRYVEYRMSKESRPRDRVRCWVEAVFSQAEPETAADTRAVLFHTGGLGAELVTGQPDSVHHLLAALLHAPFAALGVRDPAFAATLVAYATVGKLSEYLWSQTQPTAAEIDRMVAFCVAAAVAEAGEE